MVSKQLDWTLLRSFLAMAAEGSLSNAARALRLTQPTIGRHLDELESKLRVRLFVRSSRGLTPTEAALDLVPYAKTMAATVAALERAASGETEDERGTLRLAASDVIGVEVLPPILARFRERHPRIAIELVLSNRNEDLFHREADLAVRMMRPEQQQLVARRIGAVPIHLYAHRDYVRRRGLPKSVTDLADHDVIGYDTSTAILAIFNKNGVPVTRDSFALRTDNDIAQIALLRAGAGIGGMQRQLAVGDEKLVPVLHSTVTIPLDMWLVMHEDLRTSRRVRLLFDHLAGELTAYVRRKK